MKKTVFAILTTLSLFFLFTSCARRPYQEEKFVDIGPNETAYVIPLEQGTKNQKALKSVEYLEEKKVASKRIYTPTVWHQTGRWDSDGEYIPSVIVIKVDRSPVTREWTKSGDSGTSRSNQQINVESSNSIGFTVGITCTASVPEDQTSTFLYWYGGKSLSQVIDDNIRSYVQENLTRNFGQRDLTKCQLERKDVFTDMEQKTKDFFTTRGIRIDNIGAAGEFTYTEPDIQVAINSQFIAEKKNDAAKNEVAAAQEYAKAGEAIKSQKNLDAQVNIMNALAEAIKSGRLQVPQTLVMSPGMSLMDLYGAKNLNLQNVKK
jgi:hypothetical protein